MAGQVEPIEGRDPPFIELLGEKVTVPTIEETLRKRWSEWSAVTEVLGAVSARMVSP